MKKHEIIKAMETAHAEAKGIRSAWDKGVHAYAEELLGSLKEWSKWHEGESITSDHLREICLNGARDWEQYSWGGSSLIYDRDIALRLCSPSELKKTRNGERKPNAREEWLDTQARALNQAMALVNGYFVKATDGTL